MIKRVKEMCTAYGLFVIGVCTMIFVTDKIFDCKRNLSRFCSVAVFSGFSGENESMLTILIYTV